MRAKVDPLKLKVRSVRSTVPDPVPTTLVPDCVNVNVNVPFAGAVRAAPSRARPQVSLRRLVFIFNWFILLFLP